MKLRVPLVSDAGTGGARGAMAPPIFGRSVNPIPTGEGRLSPPITTGTPNVFHLPASLKSNYLPTLIQTVLPIEVEIIVTIATQVQYITLINTTFSAGTFIVTEKL